MPVLLLALLMITISSIEGELNKLNASQDELDKNFTMEMQQKATFKDQLCSASNSPDSLDTSRYRRDTAFEKKMAKRINNNDVATVVGGMIWQTLDIEIAECQNVFLTTNSFRPLVYSILRHSSSAFKALLVVDLNNLDKQNAKDLSDRLWGDNLTSCRTLLLDVTDNEDQFLFSFLEKSRLWMWAEVRVVIVGNHTSAQLIPLQRAFRNVPQPLFLGLEDELLQHIVSKKSSVISKINEARSKSNSKKASDNYLSVDRKGNRILIYSRCLYCDEGNAKSRLISFWMLGSDMPLVHNPFPDQEKNMEGHLLKIVAMILFPYSDYDKDKQKPGSIIAHRDCLDKRMLATFSKKLNFRYEVHSPWDGKWGRPDASGNWTGMVGTIQHGKADFTTMIALNPPRTTIIDFARVYDTDILALVSLKPQALPRYLLIIRPFTGDVWLYLLFSIILWGVALWLLQKLWSLFSRGKHIPFSEAMFYGWAVVLEDPPQRTPTNITGQMMVGWWLIACLVISTGFKSGLVANLTVESMSKPIDRLDDMVQLSNWKWGTYGGYLSGSPGTYFSTNPDPVVKKVAKSLEAIDTAFAGLTKVSKGKYSYLDFKNGISTKIASYHTDDKGWTPFYISKYGNKILSDFGWGLRKGAPFGTQFKVMMDRLIEGGIVDHWTKNVMTSRVAANRKEIKTESQDKEGPGKGQDIIQSLQKKDVDSTVLRMSHMLGVFMILLLGFGLSFLVFVGETMSHKRPTI